MCRVFVVLALLGIACPSPAQSTPSANDLAHKILANELKAENADHSHWMLRLDTQKPNAPEEVDEVVETKDGDLKYPILTNGHKLTEQQQRQADMRIQHLLHDPAALRKSQRAEAEDEAHSQQMLKMLPQAFIFQYGERRGDLVQLNFKPNPHFRPPNREAKVFHAMEGSIWLDTRQGRLAQITGHLTHEVKFGGGLLGHLNQGGQFDVEQEEVAPGYWELTALNVQMNGKALFFKTISVRQKYSRSDFKRVPDNLDVAQGVQMLRHQVASEQATLR
jgi:hypothetical protein